MCRINTAVYLAGLLPFVLSGALIHGWTGGHLTTTCFFGRLYGLEEAVLEYADEHGGRLPAGANMEEVRAELEPYLHSGSGGFSGHGDGPCVCPARAVFERHPSLYVWNAGLSGRSLQELKDMPSKTPLVSCDFAGPRGSDHSQALTIDYLVQRDRASQRAAPARR